MTEYYVGDFPLILRRHPRARNLKLRFEAKSSSALLTLPHGVSDRKAIQFAQQNHGWIKDQYDKAPKAIPLQSGQIIPFQGKSVTILHEEGETAIIKHKGDHLIVGGPKAAFEKRLQNWLIKQARITFKEAVDNFAPLLQHRPHRIMVRDTKSRWGSCSSKKTLSFSWRLIMAPPEILHYVVAHEMAHLVEMNHSPAFWNVVGKLCPDWRKSRRWLKSKGNGLMIIG